ncbi:MAG TPA: AarF/UbiB family protein [Spirochaetia bacterium]|nr:AarF/UbiB family protein [Spirochaetia bacterium]
MFKSRYRQILWFFWRVIVSEAWWDIFLPKIGLRRLSGRTRIRRLRDAASRFRTLAIRMGGVLIKVGQFLSSRVDVLPREITNELSDLQDEVGAEPFEDIRAVLEEEFGAALTEKFVEFDPVPVASASIGQVHRARICLFDSEGHPCATVMVKVQRPRIREIVEADLAAIKVVGGWVSRYRTISRHVNVPRLIEEFSRSLYEEIDYLNEGKNAERFAENFGTQSDIIVPRIVWSHTTLRVLTLEDVGAIKIGDYAGIEAAGIERKDVAKRLVDTYLKQVFADGFFHADPHPGNLFVDPGENGIGWKLTFVDFGMTGTLTPRAFRALREALISVATRDAARLVDAFETLDVLLPGADVQEIERASRRVFDDVWGKSTREMANMSIEEVKGFTDEFGDLLYEMPFQVPENLILLGRCVSILSGMASGLDPEFNLWHSIVPYARKLLETEGSSAEATTLNEINRVAGTLATLPGRFDALLTRIDQGKVEIKTPDLRTGLARIDRNTRKIPGALVFTGLILSGTQLYLAGHDAIAAVLGGLAALILLWLLIRR